jgi:hypothetical protein
VANAIAGENAITVGSVAWFLIIRANFLCFYAKTKNIRCAMKRKVLYVFSIISLKTAISVKQGAEYKERKEKNMDRWTMQQLKDTDDLTFAIAILNERRNKLNPYSPLAEKLKATVRTIEKIKESKA